MTTYMATSKDTILVITNDTGARLSLGVSLKEAGYEVQFAANEQSALDLLQHGTPALIMADRQACDFDRFRVQKGLRTTPMIALQEANVPCGEDECLDDLDRGADLVLCNQSSRELVARVRAILRRKESDRKPAVYRLAGGLQMDLDRHEVKVSGRPVELTPKEFQILRHFLEAPSRVFSRQEMLNCVWGEGYALEEHALDVHIHSLRQKIEEDPAKPKLIVTVRGVGYKLRAGT